MEMLINIDVEDLETAVAFYRDALGLRLERRLFNGTVAEMSGASSKIHLLTKPDKSAAAGRADIFRSYRRHWTPVHLDFEVDNIDGAVNRAVAAGATLEGGIQAFTWGHQATLSDPFGHGFCLLQFTGRGYSEVVDS
jgi:predicted enzyme related to lactoylglutathione lyase